ncbi:MAG: hypothetical protein ABIH29_04600 [Candidatus Micrarchaeota archaeon]
MKFGISAVVILMLLSTSFAALDLTVYYGIGCSHCAKVDTLLEGLQEEYQLNIEKKEIYYDAGNRQDMFDVYADFGMDPGKSGVPSLVLDGRSLLIGEMSQGRFREIFDEHLENSSVAGVYTADSFSPVEERDPTANLTLWILITAAAVDSVNPCTIAVMTMLLGVIMASGGKRKVLPAAITFIGIIFISYFLMGLGILQAVADTGLVNLFLGFVTVMALVLAILEIKAYLQYTPGMLSVEIPMFVRPFMKKAIANATSLPAVALAALICSLVLLPCSSGPYLMVLSMLAKSVTLQGLFYLIIYNLVFIFPMLAIAAMVYFGKISVDEIGQFREQNIQKLHLIAGLIFILLFLMLLNQMLGIVAL